MKVRMAICLLGLFLGAGPATAEETLAEDWARSIRRLSYEDLTPAVRAKLLLTLCDSVGAMTSTRTREEVRRYRAVVDTGGRAEATELVGGRRVPTGEAAAINAFALHGHEVDDSNLRNNLRASCVALPAPLALAERSHASGRAFLTALAVSYQVSDRLATFMNEQPAGLLHRKGLMPASVCGVVGAAAAGGKLLGLSQDELVSAIGLAAGGANGLFQYYLEGSDEKRIHVARSQALAVESVLLARHKFRGARGSLDGKAGLLRVLGFPPDGARLRKDFDRFDAVLYVKPKFYACSQGVIPWLETLEPVRKKHGLRGTDVRRIVLHLDYPPEAPYMQKINHFRPPQSIMAAQLSVNYCIALFLLKGGASDDEFTDANLRDERVLGLAGRVSAVLDREHNGQAVVTMNDGKTFTGQFPLASIHEPYRPIEEAYRKKFDALTRQLPPARRQALWDHVFKVGEAKDMADWCAELRRLMGAKGE